MNERCYFCGAETTVPPRLLRRDAETSGEGANIVGLYIFDAEDGVAVGSAYACHRACLEKARFAEDQSGAY